MLIIQIKNNNYKLEHDVLRICSDRQKLRVSKIQKEYLFHFLFYDRYQVYGRVWVTPQWFDQLQKQDYVIINTNINAIDRKA